MKRVNRHIHTDMMEEYKGPNLIMYYSYHDGQLINDSFVASEKPLFALQIGDIVTVSSSNKEKGRKFEALKVQSIEVLPDVVRVKIRSKKLMNIILDNNKRPLFIRFGDSHTLHPVPSYR